MIKTKVAVIFAAAVLTISPAYAFDHENFSIYSTLYGASDIDDSQADIIEDCARFYQDDCVITFRFDGETVKTIMIEGQGDRFLAYCYGSLFQFDPDANHAAENGGRLLGNYLLAHNPDRKPRAEYTVTGIPFKLEQTDSGYSFIISGGD